MGEAPAKPNRPPDYVSKNHRPFWWQEMLTHGPHSGMERMFIDGDGALHVEDRDGDHGRFRDEIKEAYDKWWYETFEKHFTDIADEE